jgi:predicted house-cleaning noncanonical NTP pyrophosphatase (MazG superfamily)
MNDVKKNYKLIRDKIPQIIQNVGKTAIIEKVNNKKTLMQYIKTKIIEEANEVLVALNKKQIIEEIADLYEIIDKLIFELKIKPSEIIKTKQIKKNKRGGFTKNLIYKINDK